MASTKRLLNSAGGQFRRCGWWRMWIGMLTVTHDGVGSIANNRCRFRWRGNRYVALKIGNSGSDFPEHERDLEDYIAKQDPLARRLWGGLDVSWVLWDYSSRGQGKKPSLPGVRTDERAFLAFPDTVCGWNIPLPLIKAYLMGILSGLEYLHSICKIAHGGESFPFFLGYGWWELTL